MARVKSQEELMAAAELLAERGRLAVERMKKRGVRATVELNEGFSPELRDSLAKAFAGSGIELLPPKDPPKK